MNQALLPKRETKRLEVISWALFAQELHKVSSLALPFMAVAGSQYPLQAVSLIMAGQLGKLSLSAATIATCFCNVTGFTLLSGFAGALETLCGKAYGAMQYEKIGSFTYCGIIFTIPICLAICLLWMFMERLLVLIGLDPQISTVAYRYALWLIPALFAYAILQSLVRYFQSQSMVVPILLVSWVTLCLHIPVCWILVFKSGLGYRGAALAIGLSYWFSVLLLGFYMRYSSSCEKTRVLFIKDVFLNVREFFCFAIPSTVLLCLEWCSFQSLIVLIGLLPHSKLEASVLSACFTATSLQNSITFGISAAASIRISNEVGAGDPMGAQLATLVVIALVFGYAVVTITILVCCQLVFGYAVTKMVHLLCLSVILDSLIVVLHGIVRGMGRQLIGMYANFAGISMGVLCGYFMYSRGAGLRIGILTGGAIVQRVVLLLVVAFTNWEKQLHCRLLRAREIIFVAEGKCSAQNESCWTTEETK